MFFKIIKEIYLKIFLYYIYNTNMNIFSSHFYNTNIDIIPKIITIIYFQNGLLLKF